MYVYVYIIYVCVHMYAYVNEWFYNILGPVLYSRILRILRMSNTTHITHGSIYTHTHTHKERSNASNHNKHSVWYDINMLHEHHSTKNILLCSWLHHVFLTHHVGNHVVRGNNFDRITCRIVNHLVGKKNFMTWLQCNYSIILCGMLCYDDNDVNDLLIYWRVLTIPFALVVSMLLVMFNYPTSQLRNLFIALSTTL